MTSCHNLSDGPYVEWRGVFDNEELNDLHTECFDPPLFADDWWAQVNRHSLGWVRMRQLGELIGFVLMWLGTAVSVHFFWIVWSPWHCANRVMERGSSRRLSDK